MAQYSIIDKLKSRLNLIDIDFNKPWWRVVTDQRLSLFVVLIGRAIASAASPLMVYLISMVFMAGRFDLLFYLFIGRGVVYAISFIETINNTMLQIRSVHSITYRAHQWFLQIDPIFHMRRSSGAILGKIERASRAYEDIIYALTVDMLMVFIGSGVVVISLCWHNMLFGLFICLILIGIFLLNFAFSRYVIIPYEKKFIKSDDKLRSLNVENLMQISLIRTCFATSNVNDRLAKRNTEVLHKEGKLRFLYAFFYFGIKMTYLVSLLLVAWYAFSSVKQGLMSVESGIAMILAYMRGTHDVVRVERPIGVIIKSTTRINDLFSYIRGFGEKTITTLDVVPLSYKFNFPVAQDPFTLSARNIYFEYGPGVQIFEKHQFVLTVPQDASHKLYGIIGPSGVGKSTISAILGGQIRPMGGKVFINDVDIYQVSDSVRQRLIALQGQVASSIRGTLRYNLEFGLPKHQKRYTDRDLVDVLKKVGLWSMFEYKKGLETFVGEGGSNFSGGQRQRLNFANLYLRANFYNPPLILIDEPTSSLDAISERSITSMINELAEHAVTMVIAHRLNTLNDAVGIMDAGLLATEKEVKFYNHKELQEHSVYYRSLLAGQASLED